MYFGSVFYEFFLCGLLFSDTKIYFFVTFWNHTGIFPEGKGSPDSFGLNKARFPRIPMPTWTDEGCPAGRVLEGGVSAVKLTQLSWPAGGGERDGHMPSAPAGPAPADNTPRYSHGPFPTPQHAQPLSAWDGRCRHHAQLFCSWIMKPFSSTPTLFLHQSFS